MPTRRRSQSGYSLIELMVAIVIGLFLIGGVLMIEQTVNLAHRDNDYLAQADDDERFAVTLFTELGQRAGYYGDQTHNNINTALPSVTITGTPDNATLSFQAGESVYGTVDGSGNDGLAIRYMTRSDGSIPLCDGTAPTSSDVYVNYLYLSSAPGIPGLQTANHYLDCVTYDVSTGVWGSPVELIDNVQNMYVYYGINTNNLVAGTDQDSYNVDTYVPTGSMTGTMSQYWTNVTALKAVFIIYNPLKYINGQPQHGEPEHFQFTTVVALMNRTGPHS